MPTTLPATDPHAAFRATIADAPDDFGPRLVFADWLEEYSREQIDHDYAEFLRVGCELSEMPSEPKQIGFDRDEGACFEAIGGPDYFAVDSDDELPIGSRVDVRHYEGGGEYRVYHGLLVRKVDDVPPDTDFRFRYRCKRDKQSKPWPGADCKARSHDLLARHGMRWAGAWLGDVPWVDQEGRIADGVWYTATQAMIGDPDAAQCELASWTWHAGAPADFKLPTMAAWRGSDCDKCQGTGKWFDVRSSLHGMKCYQCANGRAPGLGAAIVRACPVRSVECGDKEPRESCEKPQGLWFREGWIDDHGRIRPGKSTIPDRLFVSLEYDRELTQWPERQKYYPTAALARAALARVMIAEAWGGAPA